jgi:NAD(P)-dependent dehydrogenase (short-subunit alcohol dehydrogenase family)
MEFKDKTIVITGAAGSLGKAVAEAFRQEGASLVLLDVNEDVLAAAYPQIVKRWLLAPTNLLDPAAVAATINDAVSRFGKIDALCNIAGGFTMGSPVHATPMPDYTRMLEINALTMLNSVQAVAPRMIAQKRGRIVNIAAGAGQKGQAMMGAYSVAKSAVIRLTESMSAELREQGINVNCVLPSIIDTPPNRAAMPDADASKWVAPADLAQVILFLCSDRARAVHGAAIPVTGLS